MTTRIYPCVLAAAMLAACSSPMQSNPTPASEQTLASARPAPAADGRDVKQVQAGVIDPLSEPNGALAQRSVYFDYDSYAVRDTGLRVVENHSGYLGKNTGRRIIIQGNTDERGGTEYNLALGQKRAEAVRKSLAVLGVADSQMEAVSLGEVKPKATGTGEANWAQNRRADIVY